MDFCQNIKLVQYVKIREMCVYMQNDTRCHQRSYHTIADSIRLQR